MRRPTPYDVLRDAIVSGELDPETPLVEARIAQWIGVSRTPVREALRRLESEGLVQRIDRSLHVRNRSPEEIFEIYNVRILLESAAAEAAAEGHSAGDRATIATALKRMEEAPSDTSAERMAELNVEFHAAVWKAGHNDTLLDLLDRLRIRLQRYRFTTYARRARWEPALDEHRQLAEAIFARDAPTAAAVTERHLIEARDLRLELLTSSEIHQ